MELQPLSLDDYESIKSLTQNAYAHFEENYWTREELEILIKQFPKGQRVIKIDDEVVGYCLSIRIDETDYGGQHTYDEVCGDYTFDTHQDNGDSLYGIEVIVKHMTA